MTSPPDEPHAIVELALREAMAATAATLAGGVAAVVQAASAVGQALAAGGKVLVFGNGGSAAEAQHLAAEMVGRFLQDRRPLAAVALTADSSVMTALGNDYAFERVFARQIEALGRPGDVAVGISTSGRSANVVRGLEAAHASGLVTIAITGAGAGALASVADIVLTVPHAAVPRVQEVHLMLIHALCELVDRDVRERAAVR
jgi:D-sedoheptulose 7-phosphate isomerase